jgi:hypothetical protein
MTSRKSIISILIFSGVLSSCSRFQTRNPASFSDTLFSEIITEIETEKEKFILDKTHCSQTLNNNYQKLFELVGKSVYFEMDNIELLDKDISRSFQTRLNLREMLRDLNIQQPNDRNCFMSIVELTKAFRYVEDYMIELRMNLAQHNSQDFVDMKSDFPYLLVNPKYANEVKSYEDLKSGDVILSRGNAFSSAAIARIGESDFQFSHLSFIYRDLEDFNKMYTTEAHIEIGSVVAPMEDHIASKNARSVVFRYKDANLASEASKHMFNRVKNQSATGKNIEYDFSMNYKDDSKLFCSEIVSSGLYAVRSENGYIPKYKSKFSPGMIPFLNNIGVPVNKQNIQSYEVFSPGDIQFDPNFDLVLEWRNPKKMEQSRLKDFILTKLFDKMENEGYEFDTSLKMDLQSKTFWLLRRTPIVKKFLDKKFPLNMNATQMEMFMVLDQVGEILLKEIESKSLESDHSLTPKEVYTVLDEFLAKDYEVHQKAIENRIHDFSLVAKYFHK